MKRKILKFFLAVVIWAIFVQITISSLLNLELGNVPFTWQVWGLYLIPLNYFFIKEKIYD